MGFCVWVVRKAFIWNLFTGLICGLEILEAAKVYWKKKIKESIDCAPLVTSIFIKTAEGDLLLKYSTSYQEIISRGSL